MNFCSRGFNCCTSDEGRSETCLFVIKSEKSETCEKDPVVDDCVERRILLSKLNAKMNNLTC